MARLLITGMSGTGKSSVLARLADRGHSTIDMDDDGWSQELPTPDGRGREQLWREEPLAARLAQQHDGALFVAGCARNQGRFYDRFDAVVLLSLPERVLRERLAHRDTNTFGKDPAELERILLDLATVEPLLRRGATVELDARLPPTEIADVVEQLAHRST